MEPVLNDKDEEEMQHARRVQRTEKMKQEKMLQEKRRSMIRQYLPMAVSSAGVVILLIIGIVAVVRKTEQTEPGTTASESGIVAQIENQTIDEATEDDLEAAVSDIICVGIDREDGEAGSQTQAEDEAAQSGQAAVQSENEAAQSGQAKTVDTAPLYTFTPNDDTVTIYSEDVVSTNAVLVNESTDTIIASKAAKERICPASMTKVLTVLVAAEQIMEAQLDDTFTMTKEITDYAYVNDCSSVGFLDGEKVPVRDLFYGTVLPSGGDAAVGLATYIAGSHEAFVDMMNAKLEELGLSDSAHFTNCVGLYDEEHYCTVYDMAVIMKAAVNNEMCRDFLSAHTYTTTPTTEHPEGITISNWFLRRIEDKDTGGEVLCAKTGYVVQSKNCAVSYGTFADGVPYICVTAGSTSSWRCIYDHVEIYNRYIRI